MQAFLDTILAITAEAEKIPRRYFRTSAAIDWKPDATPVTVADRETEAFIRAGLAQHFPDHAIFGEEYGATGGERRFQWVIDPIDGTRAFVSGMPLYGMLVALLDNGGPVLGLIRMPELAEVYTGDGARATLNGEFLRAAATTRLADAMVYINEADKMMRDQPQVFARLNRAGRDRRFGYDCYPHALVAAGHVDACIDFDLKPYDYLPLVPVITGAGGVISDWQGQPLGMASDGRVVSAATAALHAEVLGEINRG